MTTFDIVIISSGSHAVYNVCANCFDRGETASRRGSHDVGAKEKVRFREGRRGWKIDYVTEDGVIVSSSLRVDF